MSAGENSVISENNNNGETEEVIDIEDFPDFDFAAGVEKLCIRPQSSNPTTAGKIRATKKQPEVA